MTHENIEKTKKVVRPKNKKTKPEDEKIEVCFIIYECSNNLYSNFHLHKHVDRYPIEEICGFNEIVFKNDVSFSLHILSV